jgi:mono/diheme cytochrome c family protein
MLDNTLRLIIGIVLCLGTLAAVLPRGVAADSDPKNPLSGMTAVEASKGLALPEGAANEAALKGKYLVGLLGCASCHTDGALIGKPDASKTLAGSTTGIAYSNPMTNAFPGAVYPPNLTPDPETGLGEWTLDEIVTLLRSGKTRHGRQTMAIMPWTSYAQLSNEDATAIASYLKSLPPVKHRVPQQVLPRNPTRTPIVHVGLYRSR